ncbi:hypothetical protein OG738_40000 [Amycolatopsis sp. NBC_01488]|uniref:hypothetical protein n=1 Tax=Amycolatopsis sp. NBC_01488 TaxID=2903563 RepID=UPI002E2CA918|nr:hypothetical protein [Amycolatopsis sp. NBC_01488]
MGERKSRTAATSAEPDLRALIAPAIEGGAIPGSAPAPREPIHRPVPTLPATPDEPVPDTIPTRPPLGAPRG